MRGPRGGEGCVCENLTTFCFLARGNDTVFSTGHLPESLPSCITALSLNYLLYITHRNIISYLILTVIMRLYKDLLILICFKIQYMWHLLQEDPPDCS